MHRVSRISTFISYAYPEEKPFDFQVAFYDDHVTRKLLVESARQVGKSSMSARKATMIGLSVPKYKHIWCSYTLDDCKEKIEYSNDLIERLAEFKEFKDLPERIEIDNRLELKFANGSRLISVFVPRGKSKADITLDEFAHVRNPRKIWKASTPILIHGGKLSIMSTPTHGKTMFARIKNREGGKFTTIKRARLFWYDCPIHCRDVARARIEAPTMPTEDRVRRFGTEALIDEFENNFLEDFQQEFELIEIDDDLSFLPWELILASTPAGEDEIKKCDTVAELRAMSSGRACFAGYDVGRRKHLSELSVFCLEGNQLLERYRVTLKRKAFDVQEAELTSLLSLSNVLRLKIDETGLGMQLAERLQKRFGHRVIPVTFWNAEKASLASNMRMLMEQSKVLFQNDMSANYQMHSVKKHITNAENVVLIVEDDSEHGDQEHHADIFWARALALSAYNDRKALGKARVRWA